MNSNTRTFYGCIDIMALENSFKHFVDLRKEVQKRLNLHLFTGIESQMIFKTAYRHRLFKIDLHSKRVESYVVFYNRLLNVEMHF